MRFAATKFMFLFLLMCALAWPAGDCLAVIDSWSVTTWPAATFASKDGINGHLSPGELVLDNNPLDYLLLFDATDYTGIWDLEVCHGLLYMGAGSGPMSDTGGDILTYDYGSHSLEIDFEVSEEGIVVLKAQGDTICSPGIDNLDSHEWGNLYINTGDGWMRMETIPHAVHVLDVTYHNGKIWVTTGLGSGNGLRSCLFSSDDLGVSWTEEFLTDPIDEPGEFRRLYGATSFNGSLFAQSDNRAPEGKVLFEFPPSGEMVTHEIGAGGYCLAGFEEYHGDLLYFTSGSLSIWDGQGWTVCYPPVHPISFVSHAIIEYDDMIYLGGYENMVRSSDFDDWESVTVEETFERDFKTIENYHGRLYVGSVPYGEVFVSAALSRGEMTARPYRFQGTVLTGTIAWSAIMQDPACTLRFQLRSGVDETALASAEFVGPDGTPASWYETSATAIPSVHIGDSFFQYRVEMTTADPLFAPVLEEFRLDVDLDTTAIPHDLEPAGLEVWPNPFSAALNIRFADAAQLPRELDIYDIRGRCVRTMNSTGGALLWDGRDRTGAALPAGVYLIRIVADNNSVQTCRVMLLR
ncbi:MAG: T9SS type A sorting domain-containing protein [bacterium]|nr:T9SS type A sorting domain-containing protein [bacterium]